MPAPLHASAVAFGEAAVLLTGRAGSGKSTLALSLIGLGGVLVADDRVAVERRAEALWLAAPEAIRGRIEARQFGILELPFTEARARAVVDMEQVETARLPEPHRIVIEGVELPLFRKVESPAFPAILRCYLSQEQWHV